ncbi:hypothetical protein WJU16_21845 [Chitinophaga pollutisoli]|uniref:Uncharacterized protein n=1 Tax=Chitinophaga pollutisoli TaxID=3133966 RepID=A0ABZ2YNW8_9BACT
MKLYFTFYPETHNYWPVYDAIKKFYPIGLHPNDSLYSTYKGRKMLGDILVERVHDPVQFKEFSGFSDKVGAAMGCEVIGWTFGQEPSLAFEVILEKIEQRPVSYARKLYFAKSLLGDFYTIYGLETTTVWKEDGERPQQYRSDNVITVSPIAEFREPFLALKQLVNEHFPHHKQVPFGILRMVMPGLHTPFDGLNESTVFHALFSQHYDAKHPFRELGDMNYAADEWLKEGVTLEDAARVQDRWVARNPFPDAE